MRSTRSTHPGASSAFALRTLPWRPRLVRDDTTLLDLANGSAGPYIVDGNAVVADVVRQVPGTRPRSAIGLVPGKADTLAELPGADYLGAVRPTGANERVVAASRLVVREFGVARVCAATRIGEAAVGSKFRMFGRAWRITHNLRCQPAGARSTGR